jgi:carboxypeptidase C (cathepsin A)
MVVLCAWIFFAAAAFAADPPDAPKGAPAEAPEKVAEKASPKSPSFEKPSVTHHVARINGEDLRYTATAGYLQTQDSAGKPRAEIFYTAYVKDEAEKSDSSTPADSSPPAEAAEVRRAGRPITFAFNGGPGAASMWLNLGALGPKRVQTADEGKSLPNLIQLVDNEFTWLEFTDLVFVDPVGTGYSRPAAGVEAKTFYNVEADVESAANFIQLYVTRNERWLSPKFLAGESYGGTRAAALSIELQNALGMNLRGIVLISSVLDFQTISFDPGNDLPYALYLPAYTAIAWYHKKLPEELQRLKLPEAMAEAERWATEKYLPALARGDSLTDEERGAVVKDLARYSGLPAPLLMRVNLRVANRRFAKELLRDQDRVLGVMDGRVAGFDTNPGVPHTEYDPSFYIQTVPFVACMNAYLRSELKFETDLEYEYLSGEVSQSWKWGEPGEGYLNELHLLCRAVTENMQLKLFVANGIYDLNTSYFATKYALNHMELNPNLQGNVRSRQYPAGHMLYSDPACLKQLKEDVAEFYKDAR